MMNKLRAYFADTSAIAMVEFAMVLPVLISFFYGGIETTRYILLIQKTEKLATTVADVVAQSGTVTIANLNQLMDATEDVMEPFDIGVNSKIVISSLYRPPGATSVPRVNWKYEGGGTLPMHGGIGAVGAIPVMPVPFPFDERENVIAAEVYYQFTPLVTSEFYSGTTIYRSAFFKPRLGLLTSTPT